MQAELLVNTRDEVGENPLWDEKRGVLYWCDIPHGEIYVYNPTTATHRLIYQGGECGAFTLQEDGQLLLLLHGSMAVLDPETGVLGPKADELAQDTGRFNDCIADSHGRVFTGTVDFEQGRRGGIHLIETSGSCRELWRGTGCSNGWGFSPDGSQLYFSDTTARHVLRYPFEGEDGSLTEPEVILSDPDAMNDGLTVDAQGNLWVAYWNKACLRHYSPAGMLLDEISLPVQFVTSCCFGGPVLGELYITTAGGPNADLPQSGGLFRLRPAIGGLPQHRSQVHWK